MQGSKYAAERRRYRSKKTKEGDEGDEDDEDDEDDEGEDDGEGEAQEYRGRGRGRGFQRGGRFELRPSPTSRARDLHKNMNNSAYSCYGPTDQRMDGQSGV